jgi:hypothetical protein
MKDAKMNGSMQMVAAGVIAALLSWGGYSINEMGKDVAALTVQMEYVIGAIKRLEDTQWGSP